MKNFRPLLLLSLFAAGLSDPTAGRAAETAFDRWADDFAAGWVRTDPEFATTQQYFTGAEQDALDRQLTADTPAARAARVALAQRGLAELAKFDRAALTAPQRVSAAALEWQLQEQVRREEFADFDFVFNQFTGLHVDLVNFLSQTHPIRNPRDIENYLVRLGLVAGRIDDGLARASDAAHRGFLMPSFIIQSSLGQLERFLAPAPGGNILVTSLDERAAKLDNVPPAERAAAVAATARIVGESIIPAYRRVQAHLQEQLPRATADAGVWRLPGGDRAYANALRRFTTTDLTATEIHETGLREVARIEATMDGLLRQLGYTDGSVKERFKRLNLDSQPPAEPDPRPALIARHAEIVRDAERRAALIFDLRPRAPVEVRRVPPFTEKTAAAHYTEPALDGTRPGIFWAPLPGPVFEILRMRSLAYHEAVPGHHFQLALQNEMTGLPRFRRDRVFGFISAHGEGWALYAEQLAAENGWYDGDIKGRLGQLDYELFRARRLVVDTGIHVKKWTRQQAIDYGISASEVERYTAWPGQACSYKIGMLKLLELRAKAQAALGAGFSLKEFHNVILRAGTVPLAVLETLIDDWIAASPPAPAAAAG